MPISQKKKQRMHFAANTLTLLGVIPFLLAFLSHYSPILNQWTLPDHFLSSYAAIILSFLGGIHWGLGMKRPSRYSIPLFVTSNIIALLAWSTFFVSSTVITLLLLIIGFSIQLIIDFILMRERLLPIWFYQTRILVSALVISLLALIICSDMAFF